MSQQNTEAQVENVFTSVATFSGLEMSTVEKHDNLPGNALAATDQQRAVAEVQAALVIAASRPRNEVQSRDRLLRACQRQSLAAVAIYQYPRGNQSVSGPSIRLAEAAARAWGNMNYGFRELSRAPGLSECEAFAWDLETNTKAVRQFAIRHWRDTKQGGYQLKDERDIYELMANQAQRRVRASILEIVPGDIIEDAMTQCETTLKTSIGGDIAKAVAAMKEAFGKFGVSPAALEKRLGCRLEASQPAQIIALRKIYASLDDGFSEPKDWFEMDAAPAQSQTAPAAPQTTGPEKTPASPTQPDKPKGRKPAAPAPEKESAPPLPPQRAADRKLAEDLQQKAPAPAKSSLTHDAKTGEVFGKGPAPAPSSFMIVCPKNGLDVDELDCARKSCRQGCPEFEE
ncbi:MAG: hypothetical protein LBO64_03280 [Desulfovibrio sp.]|jgi:hypothetical protein|nr:hypothetical protein [Desulfovibrio sp.]